MDAKRCACGDPLIPSRNPTLLICEHCDTPALHISQTCGRCRTIAVTRRT